MNLQCSAAQSGAPADIAASDREPVLPDTPILNSDGSELPFDATTGTGTLPCGKHHGQDPVLRAPDRHDRHHVLPAATDAEGKPSRRRERSAAGHPEADADHVRHLRLHVPAGLTAVLDDIQPLADRPAVHAASRPAISGPTRSSGGSPSSERRTRTSPRSPVSWPGCRSAPAGRRAARRPRSRTRGRSRATVAPADAQQGPAPQGPRPNTGRAKAGARPSAAVARPRRGRRRPRRADDPTRTRQKRGGGSDGSGQTEKRAASVEEAVEAALQELGVSEQEARIDVLQEPKGGFLGMGSQEAVVRVSVVAPERGRGRPRGASRRGRGLRGRAPRDRWRSTPSPSPISAVTRCTWTSSTSDEDDMALLIGRHGQTLDAIQELTRMAVGRAPRRADPGHRRRRGLPQAPGVAWLAGQAPEVAERVPEVRPRGGARADEPLRAEARPRCGGGDRRRRELQPGEEPDRSSWSAKSA